MKKTLLSIIALVAGINSMWAIDNNTVEITYSGNSAKVTVASNISSYVTVSSGTSSHVKIVQSASFTGNSIGEIDYILSGSSSDGEFYLEGGYKCTVTLAGVTLTNPKGPAVNIQNGKRIDVSVKKETTNNLTDGVNEDYNGCFHSKGHTEFKGRGTLNVVGNSKHAIYSKEYMEVKNCTINVTKAVKDGIHCKEFFLMESGVINISGVEDDGIQVELSGTTSTGQKPLHEEEDTGNFYMEDGTLTVDVYDYGGKHVKVDGSVVYGGGKRTFTTTQTSIEDLQLNNGETTVAYDLSGRRTDRAQGIAIVRQGGKARKVLLKK